MLALGRLGGQIIGTKGLGEIVSALKAASAAENKVFWSGGDKMREAAEAWAKANNATTLEMTAAGKRLTETTKGLDWLTESRPMWAKESTIFAQGAKGEVHVFQWGSPHKLDNMSIWREFEFPVLREQGNKIIYHISTPDGWIVTP